MNDKVKKNRNLTIGEVVSDGNDKTIVVILKRLITHPKYGKIVSVLSKAHVHDPENLARVGDFVAIKSSRKFSKLKTWELVKVVRSQGQ